MSSKSSPFEDFGLTRSSDYGNINWHKSLEGILIIFFFKEKPYILWPSNLTSRNKSRWNIKGASRISLQGRSLKHNIQ